MAVVSLPAGVFNPYSGVKTSILLLDRALARRADRIAFFKVENDGYDLGAQRRQIDTNDLPQVRDEIATYMQRLRESEAGRDIKPAPFALAAESKVEYETGEIPPRNGLIVEKKKLAADGEYSLSGERYREVGISQSSFPLVQAGNLFRNKVKSLDPRLNPDEILELWSIPAFDRGVPDVVKGVEIGSQKKIVLPGDVLLSRIVPHIRRAWVVNDNGGWYRQVASTEWIIFSSTEIISQYLKRIVVSDFFHERFMQTITGVGGSLSRANPKRVAEILIPLPPLEVQQEIVAEIEGYQKVIDGARAVVENYRPHIHVDPDWPMVKLGGLCTVVRGSSPRPKRDSRYYGGPIPRLMVADISRDGMYSTPQIDSLTVEGAAKSRPMNKGDVVIVVSGNPGLPTILSVDACIHDGFVGLRGVNENAIREYLYWILLSQHERNAMQSVGAIFKNLTTHQVKEFKVPLPPLETQRAIVAEVEAEQTLINANLELIERFEKKIQDAIARVWGNISGRS